MPAQTSAGTNTIIEIGDAGAGLLQAPDGNFYSYTVQGNQPTCPGSSSSDCSNIYQITPGGSVSVFHAFQPVAGPTNPNADGFMPTALIVGTDGNFYGSTFYSGPGGLGVIFKITPGGVFSLLKSFGANSTGLDPGNQPNGLIQGSDGNLYFTNSVGLYQLTLGGILTTIYTFPYDGTTGIAAQGTNATSLVQGSDGTFYITLHTTPGVPLGTTGSTVGGIVRITTTGTLIPVHTFALDSSEGTSTGGPLAEGSDGNFYGINQVSDISGTTLPGTAFKVTPGGTLTVLYSFPDIISTRNSALLVGSDGNFYGATALGGDTTSSFCAPKGCGTLYQLTSSGLTTLHNFEGGLPTSTVPSANPQVDGFDPNTPLVQASDGLFYGTVVSGVFKFAPTTPLPPPVQVTVSPTTILAGNPVTITWQVLNAFSLTAQQCGATVTSSTSSSGAGAWIGQQTGTSSGGVFHGSATITPTKGGLYTYALTCGGKESGFATLKVIAPLNVPATLPNGLVGSPYIIPPDEFDGVPPYTTTVTSGALPPGLGIDPATGVLTGTPKQFGTYTFGLQVIDSNSSPAKATGTTTLTVKQSLMIANGIVLKGQVGSKYSFTLPAIGGIKPYTWSISSYIPEGITLDPATGILSGTPTTATAMPTPTITIQVTDSEGTPDKTTVNLPFLILPPAPIAAVEFTQSIQVYQSLDDLKTALLANGEPPMPMISGKPAVMRVYFTGVDTATTVSLQVSGVVSETKTIDLQPGCEPSDQRSHNNSCPSVDIYFTPPSGPWVADLVLNDTTGNQLQHETLTVTSRDTAGIHLLGTSVCDSKSGLLTWNCGDPTTLIGKTELLARMMPTNSVTLDMTSDRITNVVFPATPSSSAYLSWLFLSVKQLEVLFDTNLVANEAADLAANTYSLRYGIYRHNLDPTGKISADTGVAYKIPGRGATSADFTERLGVDATATVVTHETGHTLGLRHTNIRGPESDMPPGCYNLAADSTTDWHPMITNNVQSSIQYEYPFDVSTGTVLDPNSTFELMSYCSPRWISPQRYDTVTQTLGGGTPVGDRLRSPVHAEASQLAHPHASAPVIGPYWLVSGAIQSTGVVFDPIFQDTLNGTSDPGAGTYSIEEQNSAGLALYTRYFTPIGSGTDIATGPDLVFDPTFAVSIPVTSGVSSLVVKDSTGTLIGNVAITGTAPSVSITSPVAGFSASGLQTVSWTATSPSSALTSRVLYSSNSGATWSQMGEIADNGLSLDFGSLPGTNGATALIKVLVSDGVNTGNATSIPFSVGRKVPTIVQILSPAANFVHATADPLLLIGAAYDPDDGMLHGTSLVWKSDIQGTLGNGSPLSVSLNPGTHNLTLTATDSDGNSISTSVSVLISGARPTLSLTTAANSSNCVNATVAAAPGAQGANLTLVQFSITGGATYIGIPTGNLPFTLTVPGSGSVNLVARAYDASGQSAAKSTVVIIPATCVQAVKPNPAITWTNPAAITYGTPLGSTQLNASASVPGVFSYSPVAGTVLGVGSQTLSTTFTPTDTVTYAVVTSTTTLAVTPAQLTITPVNATRTYGAANPIFTFSTSGFVNGDSASVLSGAPALTTSTTTTSSAGSYPISAAQGTLAATNYAFNFGAGTLTVTQATSAVSLQLSASSIVVGNTETVTVTVSSAGAGTPTGTINFLDGTTALGSATLTNGQASFTTSSLAAGAHTLNVSYSGDTNFSSGSGSASVTVNAAPTDFAFAAGGTTTQTVQAGQVAMYSFSLTPMSGGYPAAVTFTVSGLPNGATATFTPSSIPANGAAQTVTLNIQTAAKTAINGRLWPHSLTPFTLAMFVFPVATWRRLRRSKKRFGSKLLVITAVALGAGITGCGGKGTSSAQTYTLVVTATSGAVQHNSTLTLIVQ
ncbi:choice-of-anchor tandem repeat GloVer-containing protein [Tunturibacter empetritectus]|uniref:Repeat protein (TIGR03803 family) n=1 Tax=Tunturiibacter lichenicola TaxID=2051959 RepID=A0A7W8J8M4_9BACT|nr:choice-of-anchor tandem repeat GloVer-containing protein [Edaphobacter lichenicola]MBB5343319.1 putative repeat protein (TIGR03803 family) [Edaphobacter lichenicola]